MLSPGRWPMLARCCSSAGTWAIRSRSKALKLGLAYLHAEGFAAGELKHGPIALIEPGLPVVVVVPSPRGRGVLHDKIVSNIQEVRARGARAHDRTRRKRGRGRGALRRRSDPYSPRRRRCCSHWWRRSRCRCSPRRWRWPRATTSTSRATWRSGHGRVRCCGWPTHGCGTAGSHDGLDHHLFFLRASRALHDPHLRHHRAAIEHAKSADCAPGNCSPTRSCTRTPAWDDLATWTGSVIQDPRGMWRMFYTGISHAERGRGNARHGGVGRPAHGVRDHESPILEADGR